jgi:hypothetical protein
MFGMKVTTVGAASAMQQLQKENVALKEANVFLERVAAERLAKIKQLEGSEQELITLRAHAKELENRQTWLLLQLGALGYEPYEIPAVPPKPGRPARQVIRKMQKFPK